MNVSEWSDEQCLEVIGELFAKRVQVGSAYVQDKETGILTHQIMVYECGDLRMRSAPSKLSQPFMPIVVEKETNETVH